YEKWMTTALEAGRQGLHSPNPHVGAAIVKNGELLAKAHHERAGEDHAEVAALKLAGKKASGATLYVTLEPCNHVGRTPPCTDAIVKAGIARVVVGCDDPNPHVEGGGNDKLRGAGVEVISGIRKSEAETLIEPWKKHVLREVPY